MLKAPLNSGINHRQLDVPIQSDPDIGAMKAHLRQSWFTNETSGFSKCRGERGGIQRAANRL